jgi:nitrate/TMAO reductase-like tetraheme cytochrome c subunit
MPRPRKYIDSGERYKAFIDRHPDYQDSDRVRETKREWARANRPERPNCNRCGERLQGKTSLETGICRTCRRKGKNNS